MKYAKSYLILFVSIFFLNFLLHGVVMRSWNDMHLAGLRSPNFNFLPIFINYLFLAGGFLFFLKKMNVLSMPKEAFKVGAVFGFLLFLNLGLLNYALFNNYPFPMVISDTILNTIVFSVSAWLTSRFTGKK